MGNAIDPRIALGVQVPQIPGPIDLERGSLSVQQLINATQLQKQQQAENVIRQQQSQLELQQQQQAWQDQQNFNKAFHDAGGDWDAAIKNAAQNGVSAGFIVKAQAGRTELLTKLAQLDKDHLANEQTKNDQLAKDAVALRQIDDPQERAQRYAEMRNGHLISGAYKLEELPAATPTDDQLDSVIAHSKAAADLNKEAADLREKNAKVPGEQAEATLKRYNVASQTMSNALNQIAWTAKRNFAVKNDPQMADLIPENYSPEAAEQVRQMSISPEKMATMGIDRLEMADYLKSHPGQGPAGFLAWKTSQEAGARAGAELAILNRLNQQSQQGGRTVAPGMSPDATDSAATTYHNTGQLPAVGRGAAGVAQRTAVMNRERELFPGTVLSADSAEFKANQASLKQVQEQSDKVDAFEKTAGKNLDVFLVQAQKALDTGLPLLNLPARMVAGKLGSENQVAFDTSRQTAVNEISRVLNSANATGVVSDSARHEVEGLIKGDATLGQIMSAANILKQDMANRHAAYNEQIQHINGRLRGNNTPAQGNLIYARDPQGKLHSAPAGTPLPAGWKQEQHQ